MAYRIDISPYERLDIAAQYASDKAHIITCAWESFRLRGSLKVIGSRLPEEKNTINTKRIKKVNEEVEYNSK
jgi:hypothetical protein